MLCKIFCYNINKRLTRMPIHPSTDEDLKHLPHVIITSDEIWDPIVLIDIENNIYPPTMDSNIDKEELTSFDECTSVTGSYLHQP